MKKVNFLSKNGQAITISAIINFPKGFDEGSKHPAIVVAHPGGGYTANAAINDRRIKAVGTVSAVNIGSMFRNGWDNNIKSADASQKPESNHHLRCL